MNANKALKVQLNFPICTVPSLNLPRYAAQTEDWLARYNLNTPHNICEQTQKHSLGAWVVSYSTVRVINVVSQYLSLLNLINQEIKNTVKTQGTAQALQLVKGLVQNARDASQKNINSSYSQALNALNAQLRTLSGGKWLAEHIELLENHFQLVLKQAETGEENHLGQGYKVLFSLIQPASGLLLTEQDKTNTNLINLEATASKIMFALEQNNEANNETINQLLGELKEQETGLKTTLRTQRYAQGVLQAVQVWSQWAPQAFKQVKAVQANKPQNNTAVVN